MEQSSSFTQHDEKDKQQHQDDLIMACLDDASLVNTSAPLNDDDESCADCETLDVPTSMDHKIASEDDCNCGGAMMHSILSVFLIPQLRRREKTFLVTDEEETVLDSETVLTPDQNPLLRTSRTEPSLRALIGWTKLNATPPPSVRSTSSSSTSASCDADRTVSSPDDNLSLPTEASDLSFARPVWIVTTAALPWMTGTAVNPLLRAAYLAVRYQKQQQLQQQEQISNATEQDAYNVHLVVPWLESPDDRVELYGADWRLATTDDQAAYILDWVVQHVEGADDGIGLRIHWYPARYHSALGSIFAMGDVCARLSSLVEPNAICILEEPEHLNYYRGGQWRRTFGHVAGIIHTNYVEYCRTQTQFLSQIVGAVSAWMVRAYCDKVISLSSTLPAYAPEKEVVCNVHGVRREFFAAAYHPPLFSGPDNLENDCADDGSSRQIYFLGKLLWAKGLDRLLQLQHLWKEHTGDFFPMDIYGSGPDQNDMEKAFAGIHTELTAKLIRRSDSCSSSGSRSYTDIAIDYWRGENKEEPQPLPVTFCGRCDHAVLDQGRAICYKIFVNPSVSEVLCTVTAEAIAMGKFVIIPNHPSNVFFKQFPNCLLYDDDDSFCTQLHFALLNEPVPLGAYREALTWEGATDRLIQAAAITHEEAVRRELHRSRDQRLADWHIRIGEGTTGDVLRQVLGGGPVAKQSCYQVEPDPALSPSSCSSCEIDESGNCPTHEFSRSDSAVSRCTVDAENSCTPTAIAVLQ